MRVLNYCFRQDNGRCRCKVYANGVAKFQKIHAIAAKTTGKAEETIIQQDNGILDLHRNAVYCGNGDKDYKLPHIKFEGKIIYILGYSSRDKWEWYSVHSLAVCILMR